jgi:threonine/homoserine/homoserine lactone efflux protein
MVVTCILGAVFGFIGSMPMTGPVAVMVLSRALDKKYGQALEVGVGAAVVESVYSGIAYWGFSTFLARHRLVLPVSHAISAVVLMVVGTYFAVSRHEQKPREEKTGRALFLGFTASAFNPTLLATWSGAVAALYGHGLASDKPWVAAPFGLAAGTGNILWQLVLVAFIRKLGDRAPRRAINGIIRGMGVVLVGVGVLSAVQFVRSIGPHPPRGSVPGAQLDGAGVPRDHQTPQRFASAQRAELGPMVPNEAHHPIRVGLGELPERPADGFAQEELL